MFKVKYKFNDLVDIVSKLRAPGGCPWDAVQTHESIKKNVVEEAYELVEAIDGGDSKKIADESGDMLLQVVFHA
ncbi:MAG: MazG nucleotide pyrophosphohydrolase domain-containing protein, partial [Oscillospiraceae bacterium]